MACGNQLRGESEEMKVVLPQPSWEHCDQLPITNIAVDTVDLPSQTSQKTKHTGTIRREEKS